MKHSTAKCHANIRADVLVISNALFERRWRIRNGLLYPFAFKDLSSGFEWLARESAVPSPFPPVATLPDEKRVVSLVCRRARPSPVGAEALEAELTAAGPSLTLIYRFIVFPSAHGTAIRLSLAGARKTLTPGQEIAPLAEIPTGDEKTIIQQGAALPAADGLEQFHLAPRHLRLTQVTLQDITDNHNELAQERHWLLHTNEVHIPLTGNLFLLEDPIEGNGLIFLKEAPLPHARPIKTWADLRIHGKSSFSSAIKAAEYGPSHPRWPLTFQLGLFGHGLDASIPRGYQWVVLAYHGGRAGWIRTLQNYQRQWRAYTPGRDGLIVCNTWGDRSMNSRISESFVRKEISSAARLGVDVMQLDDGWQRGLDGAPPSGSTDLWQGIWKTTDRYWLPHPTRLPQGLDPIVQLGQRKAVRLGLWYVVDPAGAYAHWQKDLARLMELHEQHGVSHFKFDGVNLTTRESQDNFQCLVRELLTRSGGRIVVDLDVTAGIRQGYFGLMDQGPLFVENRYTDWHGYWPHQTLRNLWTLSQYVDPVRLRFEFLNPSRNRAFYRHDPLAPGRYSGDHLFATVMFSSPLAWFEVQNFPPAALRQAAGLIRVWKQHRDALFSGAILPIGSQPDGSSWTGFCSTASDGQSALVLIFRELNDRPTCEFELPIPNRESFPVRKLAGQGTARCQSGVLHARLPNPVSYLFLQLRRRTAAR